MKRPLTNEDLNALCAPLGKRYLGALPDDVAAMTLGRTEVRGKAFTVIVNWESLGESGEHWVLIWKPRRRGPVYYVDPLGREPEDVIKLALQGETVVVSKTQLQSKRDFYCGHFCALLANKPELLALMTTPAANVETMKLHFPAVVAAANRALRKA